MWKRATFIHLLYAWIYIPISRTRFPTRNFSGINFSTTISSQIFIHSKNERYYKILPTNRTFIPSNEVLHISVTYRLLFTWNAAFISFKAITCCSQNIPDLMESSLNFF